VLDHDIANDDDPVSNLPRLSYLEQMDKIIETVILQERHLFNDLELSILGIYQSLSGNYIAPRESNHEVSQRYLIS
jgi:hypothetical protein